MRYLPTLLLFLAYNVTLAQDLTDSRQTSYYTYVFKLSDQEAREVYKKDLWKVDDSYFHTLVDSFQTDSIYRNILPEGHYLKVNTQKNKLMFHVTSVQNFDVMIARNNTDLVVQVYDLKGNIIPDAHLKVRWKLLRFDKRTKSYIHKKSNQKGLLKVTWKGFTAYYDLSRQYSNSALKRTTRKVVFGTPIKYVWIPVRYVIFLPIDGVKSIVHGYPQGTISRTGHFFRKSYYKIACLFDDYYCDYYGNNGFQQKHKGYLVFNKPKYMPGDTVKLKAFIVNKNGTPINKPVDVVLQRPGKNLRLSTISPYRKGGFIFEFYLHDSLELQLDRAYTIWLEKRDGKEYINESFIYEDYELSSIQLELTTDTEDHYRGACNLIKASGTDENELNILDGRLEVLIQPGDIHQFFGDYVFVPDTLSFWKVELDKEDDTEIAIPDSIFPDANLAYEVAVTMFTSDNEKITERKYFNYYHLSSELTHELLGDSIRLSYRLNGTEIPLNATIYGVDNFGNQTKVDTRSLPATIGINPYFSDYFVRADTLEEKISLSSEPSLVQCLSERSKDSIQVLIKNPRNLPFSYYIYKKNIQKDRGYSDSLRLDINTSSKQHYFVSIQYLWGGRLYDENFQIPYHDKNLTVTVLEPKLVYPSQEATIEIEVTDPEGNPVPDVDLTAYSITKKFDYSPPEIPYLGKNRKVKSVINNFSFSDQSFENHPGLKLDYNNWKLLAGLDSIEYYQFIYPGNEIYSYQYDADITQFAPFVVSQGGIQPIHVIYVDSRPVYFSWTTHTQPYSFEVDTGYHHVKLRTSFNTVEIDSLYFPPGKKSIVSVWDSTTHKNVLITKAEPRLSSEEKRMLHKYNMPYQYRHGEHYAYIEQNGRVQFLKPAGDVAYQHMAGPVYPDKARFQMVDSFSIDFTHESMFEYEFMPGLLKMRSVDTEFRYPDYIYGYKAKESLSDEVLTEEDLIEGWRDYVDWKRYSTARYHYPRSTSAGMGEMQISLTKTTETRDRKALNILLFRYDDHQFLRIYPGSNHIYHDLAKGYYKLLFFYPGSEYTIVDSLYVASDGLNHHQVVPPSTIQKDTFSMDVSSIIEENIFKVKPYYEAEETELRQIYNAYQQEFRFTGNGEVVEGYVYDEEGNPLPGANVVVSGTTFGTVTNMEGYYSLNVPNDRSELVFSFIGYGTTVANVANKDMANVYLAADVLALEEVVVTAYGVSRKSNLTGSVSVVSTSGVPGLEADLVSGLQGKVAGLVISDSGTPGGSVSIQIRGYSTIDFDAAPLYIIDGVVFTGNIGELDPNLVHDIKILKESQATAIYGSQGANGVVIISTGGSFVQTTPLASLGADYDETFMEAASQASSIRNNFSDYAFWRPTLATNKEGKATFTAQFPDDVTSWRTFYLAMNGQKQSGRAEGVIKSYKPLMAQLAVPRFLVETDSTYAIGKVLNYTPDSVLLTTKFELDGELLREQQQICSRSLLDTLEVTTGQGDSLEIKYFLEKEDGYFDGEQRSVPVYPVGLEQSTGQFHTLQGDTSLRLTFDNIADEVILYARADVLEVIEDEISKLVHYKYACNEQLASKLKALLSEQMISTYQNKKFKRSNQVQKVIRLLLRNQQEEGLWGWWKSSTKPSMWISMHVLEALAQAKEMDYKVNLDVGHIADILVWDLESPIAVDNKLRALRILKMLNARVDHSSYLDRIERTEKLTMNQLFRLIDLKQLSGLETELDTIYTYQRETMFGNLYFSDDSSKFNLCTNDVQNTLIAYRIFRSDSTVSHEMDLQKIRNYLFENRASGSWLNTYESATIIETILPELLGSDGQILQPELVLSGAIERAVDKFPYEISVASTDTIEVVKKGDYPIYLTAYSHFWNPAPEIKKKEFEITTRFDNDSKHILKAGEAVKMVVNVKVRKDADYVMVNVPIPAGCSYGDKSERSYHEVHREYFRNETSIFCENLKQGDYEFVINLVPRYTGKYTLNPAKIGMMYFPTFNANNEVGRVLVQ